MCKIVKGAKFEDKPGIGYKVVVESIETGDLFSLFTRTPLKRGKVLRRKYLPAKTSVRRNEYNRYLRVYTSGVSALDREYAGFHFFKILSSASLYLRLNSFLLGANRAFGSPSKSDKLKLSIYEVSYKRRIEAITDNVSSYIAKQIVVLDEVKLDKQRIVKCF